MNRLEEIKSYCKHYDYLDHVNLTDLNWLIETIEQQQTTQDILLEQIKQNTLKIKEMKKNSRLILFYQLAEENLKLAEENARLKELVRV